MMDEVLRQVKDNVLSPIADVTGQAISPTKLTLLAGVVGIGSAIAASQGAYALGLILWYGNRLLDGLDGAVARQFDKQTDLGGYLDTLVDFGMYTIIPLGLALSQPRIEVFLMLAIMYGTFYINAAAFLYLSALLERRQIKQNRKVLTSIQMPSGIIEGTEAIIFFTLFFLFPQHLPLLFTVLAVLVFATTLQHVIWSTRNLPDKEQ